MCTSNFYYKIKNNKDLQKELVPLINSYIQEKPTTAKESADFIRNKIFPVAKKYGVNFTMEEFISETKNAASEVKKIDNEKLDMISGGSSRMDVERALLLSMVMCFSNMSLLIS